MKRIKRILAHLLVCALFLSNISLSTYAENSMSQNQGVASAKSEEPDVPVLEEPDVPKESPQPEQEELIEPDTPVEPTNPEETVEEPTEATREPLDFTSNKEEIGIDVYRAVYQAKDQTETSVAVNQESKQLDITNISTETLRLDVSISFLREKEHWQIKGNDTIQFSLPQKYFQLKNTQTPVPVYNSLQEDVSLATDVQIAEYSVSNNVVTVTFHPTVDEESTSYVLAPLQLQTDLVKEALDKERTTEVPIEGTNCSILLPKGDSDTKIEVTPPKQEVTGDTPDQPSQKTDTDQEDKKESTNKAEEKENLLPKIRAAFSGFANFFTGETGKDLTTSYEFTKENDNLPGGFHTVRLAVTSKEGGYVNTDINPKVGLGMSVYMDEDELYLTSEKLINNYGDFPQGPQDNVNAWMENIDEWRVLHPDVIPDYTFSYNLGEYFQGQETVQQDIILTRGEQNIKIGSCTVENGVLTIALHPVCSFMDNVYFQQMMDVSLDRSKLSDKPQEVVMGDKGKLVFQSEGTYNGETDQPEDAKFEVKKEGPSQVTGTSIEYKVSVNALQEGERLNGKTLTDIVPAGLTVTNATVLLNDNVEEEVIDNDGNPSASYTFEQYEEDEENSITSAVFTFTMELTKASYQDYIKNGINKTFKNKAELSGSDPAEKKVISEEVSTKMTAQFFKKSGKTDNLEGTRYAWKIQLNTKLSAMEDGYLVDTICETDHQYDFTKGMTIKTEDGTTVVNNFVKLDSGPPWGTLTADKIKALLIPSDFDQNKAYYYTVDETDSGGNKIANPFFSGTGAEPEYKQRMIVILPYKGLQGTDKSKAVSVEYSTKLNMHGLDAESYWDKTNSSNAKPGINNDANLLWNNQVGGDGPSSPTQDEVNFGKTIDTYPGAVVKKGVNYNPANQMLTWNVEVNKLGSDMKDVVLTDVLKTSDYHLSDDLDIQWFYYRSGNSGPQSSGLFPKNEADKDGKGRYYELITTGDETQVKIHLGNVGHIPDAPDQYEFYKLQFSLKLTDPSILALQSNNQKKHNTITMDALINDQPKHYEDTGNQTTPNILVEKEATGSYNYATYELPWKITVNPNKLHIVDAKLTDTLATDFMFGRVTKVEKNGAADADMLAQIKDENSVDSTTYPTFSLGTINDTYTIYLTTKTTEAWRDRNLTTVSGTPGSVDVPNNVKLDGTISETAINANDDAVHKVAKKALGKSGVYNKEAGTITWTIDVNKEHVNIANLKMVEELNQTEGTIIHELDPDTIQIWTVETASDGTEVLKPVTDLVFEKINGNGFTYQFKGLSDTTTNYKQHRFVFVTNLTAEAKGAKISNKVYIKNQANDTVNESGTSDGGYNGDYEFNEDVHAQGRPRVMLRKVSENSQNLDDKNKNFELDGATFGLEVCKFEVDPATKTLRIKETIHKYDKVRVSKDGEAYFTNIKTATQEVPDKSNLICVLTEDAPAQGYQNDAMPHFIYFATETGDEIKIAPDSIEYASETYTPGRDAFYQYKKMSTEGSSEAAMVVMENSPTPSSFTFNKQQIQLESYEYKDNTSSSTTENAKGVVFKGTAMGDAANKLNSFEVTSDASGNVTIQNLDPGTYLLTETTTTPGHKPGTVKLQVTWDKANSKYNYRFDPSSVTDGIQITNSTTLNNTLNTGKIEFTKFAKYEDGADKEIVKDSKNREILAGVKFRLKKTPGSTGGPKEISMSAISNANGKVVFPNLPVGAYNIYEVYDLDAVPGYETSATDKLVYQAQMTEVLDPDTGTKSITATLTAQETGDDENSIHNTPIKGSITFTKKSKDTVFPDLGDKTLPGAEFGLFRKIGLQVAEQALYTATSDEDGKVAFTNVEYGNYVLRETKVPKGYKAIDEISITTQKIKEQTLLDSGDTEFVYKVGDDANEVHDETLRATVSLIKKDKDNIGMSGITFRIYRRGEHVIGTNGEDLKLAVPEVTTDYYEYGPKASTTTEEDGTMILEHMPYGDYLLVEDTSKLDLQRGADKVAVLVMVKEGSNGTDAAIEITGSGNTRLTPDNTKNGYKNVDVSGFTEYTEQENGKIKVLNLKKYGFLDIKKAAGERANDINTSLRPYPSQSSPQYIKGAVFEISKGNDSGVFEKYLTLETNSKGQFDISQASDTQGAYLDIEDETYKHLWYGTYKIKEKSAPAGFEVNGLETEFTIGDVSASFAGHEGTAFVSFDGTSSNVQYIKKDAAMPPGSLYLNEIGKGGFYISKVEKGTSNSLSGAQFVVLTKEGKEIAALKEHASIKGQYELTNKKFSGGTYNEVNEYALKYLQPLGDAYLLLSGEYLIQEIKSPAGYKIMADKQKITVVNGENAAKLQIENVPNELTIEKRASDISPGDTGDANLLDGAQFTITNKSNKKDSFTVDAVGGKVTLTGKLTGGASYLIRETKAPEGYSISEQEVTITMGEDGTISGAGSLGNMITIYNDPIRLSFTKVGKYNENCKTTDANAVRPLQGVVFGVYASEKPDTLLETATSDKDGNVVFPKLSKGTYLVRELSTVQGYRLDTTVYHAKISESKFEGLKTKRKDGTLTLLKENKVINDVYRADITFTKVSEKDTNKILPGSEYGLYKYKTKERPVSRLRSSWTTFSAETDESQLVLVSTAVTDAHGVLTFSGVLIDTEYIVKELRAPDGSYISKNPMKITFGTETDASGKVHIKVVRVDDGLGTVKVDPDTGEIIWLEPEVEVHFLKQTPDNTMLAGAVLEVQDEKGTVIETWTSGKEAYVVSGKLIIGKSYLLVEKAAPEGYQIAEPVEFKIADDEVGPNQEKIQEVVMIDFPLEANTQNPPTKDSKETRSTAKTGDNQSLGIWLMLLLSSIGIGIFLIRKRRIMR